MISHDQIAPVAKYLPYVALAIFAFSLLVTIWAWGHSLYYLLSARLSVREFCDDQDVSKLATQLESSGCEAVRLGWKHFQQGLVHREGRWRRTTDAIETFHSGDVLDPAFKIEFFRHIPGILTGIGILCTFNGMAAGLKNAGDSLKNEAAGPKNVGVGLQNTAANATATNLTAAPSEMQKLRDVAANLLDSVAPAVEHSLVAVFLAISFLLIERFLYNWSLSKLEALHRELHAAFPRLTDSDLLHSIELLTQEIRQQASQSSLTLQALDTTSKSLQATTASSTEILGALRDYHRQTTDSALITLENLDNTSKSLQATTATSTEVLGTLRDHQRQASDSALVRLENLDNNSQQSRMKLEALLGVAEPALVTADASKEHLQDLVDISRQLREYSEESVSALKNQNSDFAIVLQNAIEKGMSPHIEAQSLQFAQSQETLNQSVSQLGQQLESALGRIQSNAADASGNQMELMVGKFQEMMISGAQTQISEMLKSVEGLSDILAAQRQSQESFNQQLQSHHQSNQDHVQRLSSEMAHQLATHQEAMSSRSNELLSQVGQEVGAHLMRAQTHQTEVLLEFRSHVDQSLRALSQQITGASDNTVASFKELLEVVHHLTKTSTTTSQEMMEKGNRSMLDTVARLTDNLLATSRTHNQELQDTLQQFRLAFQAGLEKLTDQVDRTGQTSTEAARSLLAVASGLTQQVENSTRALQTQLQTGSQEAMQTFSSNLTTQAENQMGQMQASFQELLQNLTTIMQESLREARSTQTTVSQQVQNLVTKMESFGLSTSDSTEKFAGTVRMATGEIERLLQSLQSPLQRLASLSQNFGQQTEQLQKMTTQFEHASGSLIEGSHVVLKSLKDQEVQRVQTERSLSLAVKQAEALEEYRSNLAQSLDLVGQQMVQLKTLATDVSAHSLSEFGKMREEASKFNTGQLNAIQEFLHKLQVHLADGVNHLGSAISDLGDTVEELSQIRAATTTGEGR